MQMVKKIEVEQTGQEQPDELKALKELTEEFMGKLNSIETEIDTLTEARRDLFEEYKGRLDTKTLRKAMQVSKIKKGVEHKHTFDCFLEVLDPSDGE
jgi:uncharacterized protein (UPF0335 family)